MEDRQESMLKKVPFESDVALDPRSTTISSVVSGKRFHSSLPSYQENL